MSLGMTQTTETFAAEDASVLLVNAAIRDKLKYGWTLFKCIQLEGGIILVFEKPKMPVDPKMLPNY